MKKVFLILSIVCAFFLAAGCNLTTSQKNPEANQPAAQESEKEEPKKEEPKNEEPAKTRAENLDFIFNVNTLGKTTITIKRSEWQTLCDDYRFFYKNENYVHAQSYEYEKDGQSWKMNDVGFRLRGNTSRIVPQGQDNGRQQDPANPNKDWAGDYYYNIAEQPNNDYRQTHFKVDFEEFLEDDEEQRMAGCLKSMALKRADASYTREVFCYNLFHQNGIWTAPRASLTRLIINIIEDGEGQNNSVTTVDYGVYEMFEEVNKQSLKARESGKNNSAASAWKNNKGNLWKCTDDLTDSSGQNMGVEDIRIIHEGEEEPEGFVAKTKVGNRIGYIKDGYVLDLKTNKTSLNSAKTEFSSFISELNALPNAVNANDTTAISTIKAFYEKWFDMDLFLKTYAVNIICGMDDDYWGNANNFYLYFDTASGGSGKVYFIPFDYDNTLGNSIKDVGIYHDPMDWGRGKDRPLIDKLLMVPEYKSKFQSYILECLNNDYWDYNNAKELFNAWGQMVTPYINTELDTSYCGNKTVDYYSWKLNGSILDPEKNIFDETKKSFTSWLTGSHLIISEVPAFTDGIKFRISNIPANAAVREIYINDSCVSCIDRDWSQAREQYDHISAHIFDDVWQYPYLTQGEAYEIYVKYLDTDNNELAVSNTLRLTAKGGSGALYSNNNEFSYKIENNQLLFTPAAAVFNNGNSFVASDGKYHLTLFTSDWNWLKNSEFDTIVSSIDFNDKNILPGNKGVTKDTQLMFRLYYEFNNPYNEGDCYQVEILSYDDTKNKNLHLDKDFESQLSKLDDDENYPGLWIKIDEDLPDDVRNRGIYINDKKVSDINIDGDEDLKAKTWYYPYVKAGQQYEVRIEYNWGEFSLIPATFTATSGLGEITFENIPTYSIQNNHLVFSNAITVKKNGAAVEDPYFHMNFDKVKDEYSGDWFNWKGLRNDNLDVDLAALIPDDLRPFSTSQKISFDMAYLDGVSTNAGTYQYVCMIFTHDDTRKANLHPTGQLEKRYTVTDGTSEEPGIIITVDANSIPSDAYSKELYLNGKKVSEMERQYINGGEEPAERITDTTWYYPYVNAGKEYTFEIRYKRQNWEDAAVIGPMKYTPVNGLGELSVANKDQIGFEILDGNKLQFTTVPVMKCGSTDIENPYFNVVVHSAGRPENDSWIAGMDLIGNGINFVIIDECVPNERKPVSTSDNLFMEVTFRDYTNLGYYYCYIIYESKDKFQSGDLHLTSNIPESQGGND